MATATAPYRTPHAVRTALLVLAGLLSVCMVAYGAMSLLQLATRHTSTEVDRYSGVRALVVQDASDITLTSAPAGAPLEVRARLTEALVAPERSVARGRDGTLRLSSSCPSPDFLGEFCSVEYEIAVPAGTAIQARTSAGDIDAEDLRTTLPATLRSSAGDITVNGASAPELSLSTSAGDVRASGVRARRVTADTAAGDVRLSLQELADSVDARSSAGDVTIVVPDAVYRVETDSNAGDVNDEGVRTSPAASRSIRAVTSAGDIRIEARR